MTVTRTTARSVTQFMDDPINFFGQSYTQMHSVPRRELEALQRQAMGIRFREHYESIEMLRKLADRLGVTALNEFNDVVPLLFSHTAFKSYPAALIDKKRFDLMTKWIERYRLNAEASYQRLDRLLAQLDHQPSDEEQGATT